MFNEVRMRETKPMISFGRRRAAVAIPIMIFLVAPAVAQESNSTTWSRGDYVSVQVNVDEFGNDIVGDVANEPSIAIDPTNPNRMVVGWRQYDSIDSYAVQAGWAYSEDGGQSWQKIPPGVLEPGVFRVQPVLAADSKGDFYYLSRSTGYCSQVFKSSDGGESWSAPVPSFGGQLPWIAIDHTAGIGNGNVYISWNHLASCESGGFTRSIDGGTSFETPLPLEAAVGTIDVGPDGTVYAVGYREHWLDPIEVARSLNAQYPWEAPTFSYSGSLDLTAEVYSPSVTPIRLAAHPTVVSDHSDGPTRGYVYVVAALDRKDIGFVRSLDRGATWSDPLRINDDEGDDWQWFGTMSVAPNGRIDVVWNDARNSGEINLVELFYSYSTDGGLSWSPNEPVSPMFDHYVDLPPGSSVGAYYDMESDIAGANLVYAATFNGAHDIYYLRIGPRDCDGDGVLDADEVAMGLADDCNGNNFPDNCEPDCNGNGIVDECDIELHGAADCDGNLRPDECDANLDGDALIDACDDDIDGDGAVNADDICVFNRPDVPMTAAGYPRGDTNETCTIDLADYVRIHDCLTVGGPSDMDSSTGCTLVFDYDEDGDVDLADAARFVRYFEP